MKTIEIEKIEAAVKQLCIQANYVLPKDVKQQICKMQSEEIWPYAHRILRDIKENIEIAEERVFPLCQDTGQVCVFVEIGQNVRIKGGFIEDAINRGIKKAYCENNLRKSIVVDPLNRINTNDNTPACIYYEIKEGDCLKITIAIKGFGSENLSCITMLPPSAGPEGVKDFVVKICENAGANPCPPIVVGVGIGGNFDKSAYMAKKALIRDLGERNKDEYYQKMEEELLERINMLGIGPQGFGGKTTALAVNINVAPTHIAGLPVAVNINCHVSRHRQIIL